MSRGDKRERDRAKNQAKLAQRQKAAKGGDPLARNQNDKAALEAKIAAKKAMKEQQALEDVQKSSQLKKPSSRRKKVEDTSLDDLLSAGLKGNAKGKKKSMVKKTPTPDMEELEQKVATLPVPSGSTELTTDDGSKELLTETSDPSRELSVSGEGETEDTSITETD